MQDDLLPCPFCGSDELSHGWSAPGYDGSTSTGNVECHNCNALIYTHGTEAEAIAAWNTRAPQSDRTAAMIEGARIALEAAAHLSDRNAKWAEKAFHKELILKNSDRQTHYAARNREAKELAASIRALDPTQLIKEQTDAE